MRYLLLLFTLTLCLKAELFIFGDSLSDTGNIDATTGGQIPGPRYFDGRFSNGPIWIDILAAELGLSENARAVVDGGNNYAVGGAETGALQTQFSAMVSREGLSGRFANNDLIVIWIGGNDLLNNPNADTSTMAGRVADLIQGCYIRGARRFLVNNLPDLSTVPARNQQSAQDRAVLRTATETFNTRLATVLTGFSQQQGDAPTIFSPKVFTLLEQIQATPSPLRFVNLTDEALGETTTRAAADRYVFWDGRHPTAATHSLVGKVAARLVQANPRLDLAGISGTPDRMEAIWFGNDLDGTFEFVTLDSDFRVRSIRPVFSFRSGLLVVQEPISDSQGFFRLRRVPAAPN